MIFKYNEFLNEKLSDKLSGFNKEDIEERFLNNELDYTKYKETCEKYNIELLSNEIIFDTIKKYNKNIFEYCSQHEFSYGLEKIFDSLDEKDKASILSNGSNYCNLDMIKLAIEGGVNVHYGGDYALRCSTLNEKSFEIVKYLLEHGANIHSFDEETLYNAVALFEQYDTVKYLLEHGAIVTDRILHFSKLNDNKKITNLVKKYYKLQHDKKLY